MNKTNIVILGSTGSIGKSTLSVLRCHKEDYHIFALIGGCNSDEMLAQALEFKPTYVAMFDEYSAKRVREELKNYNQTHIQVLSGQVAINQLAAHPEVNTVMAAIACAAGLPSTMAAIQAGKKVLLANKEALVTCGSLFMQATKKYNATLLPVDSEHNAIFQCLSEKAQNNLGFFSLKEEGIDRILLTGSGGTFRDYPLQSFENIMPEQAVKHPNWSMGRKISVDSSTMMNKGLEYIEAKWLFNAHQNEIKVLIHPQSIVHSMVSYIDGSVLAELGNPDMCTPIASVLSYPKRIKTEVEPLDFTKLASLQFFEPDFMRYPCLKLAIEASKSGQVATTTLNAANEVAVDAFLNYKIKFTEIAQVVEKTLTKVSFEEPKKIEEVNEIDQLARIIAKEQLS